MGRKQKHVGRAGPVRSVLVWTVFAGLTACGGEAPAQAPKAVHVPPPVPEGPIHLPVRVHLLQSSTVETLDATLTDSEVVKIFESVNHLWSPADIVWDVADVVREPALAQDRLQAKLDQGEAPSMALVEDLLPLDALSPEGWNVFLVRRLFGAPGVYLPRIPGVVTGEIGPDRGRASPNMVRVLAHELGHALGLKHIRCPDGGNLMSPGCPPLDGGPISQTQIETARRRAHAWRHIGPVRD